MVVFSQSFRQQAHFPRLRRDLPGSLPRTFRCSFHGCGWHHGPVATLPVYFSGVNQALSKWPFNRVSRFRFPGVPKSRKLETRKPAGMGCGGIVAHNPPPRRIPNYPEFRHLLPGSFKETTKKLPRNHHRLSWLLPGRHWSFPRYTESQSNRRWPAFLPRLDPRTFRLAGRSTSWAQNLGQRRGSVPEARIARPLFPGHPL